MSEVLNDKFIINIEKQEARYWSEYYKACEEEIVEKLGIRFVEIDGAVCCSAAKLDVLGFNRVIGLGISNPISDDQLEKIIEFFNNAGAKRFFVQVSPAAQRNNYEEILLKHRFEHYNNWAKFYKKLNTKLPPPKSSVIIDEVGISEAQIFNKVMKDAFEFEDELEMLLSQTIGRNGWKHYLAKDKEAAIGAGSVFLNGKFASLAIAGTKQNSRCKGAQTALITQRVNDAFDAGCEHIIVETAEDKPDKPSASNRNIKRFGFEQAYLRPNYIYKF